MIAEPPVGAESLDLLAQLLRADRVLLILPKRDGVPSARASGLDLRCPASARAGDPAPADGPRYRCHRLLYAQGCRLGAERARGLSRDLSAGAASGIQTHADPGLDRPGRLGRRVPSRPAGNLDPERSRCDGEPRALAGRQCGLLGGADQLACGPNGRVVFDETIHGYVSQPPSPLRLLFTFPMCWRRPRACLPSPAALGDGRPLRQAGAGGAGAGMGKLGCLQYRRVLGFARHHEIVVQRYVQEALLMRRACSMPRRCRRDSSSPGSPGWGSCAGPSRIAPRSFGAWRRPSRRRHPL